MSLQPGSSLNLENIKEGDDVYFDCNVMARPKATKISWKFNVSLFPMSIFSFMLKNV